MYICQSQEVVPQYIAWLNNTSCVVIYQNMIIILIPNFVPSFLWWYLCSILWSSTNNLTIQAVETTFTVSTWSLDIFDHTGNILRGFTLSLHLFTSWSSLVTPALEFFHCILVTSNTLLVSSNWTLVVSLVALNLIPGSPDYDLTAFSSEHTLSFWSSALWLP